MSVPRRCTSSRAFREHGSTRSNRIHTRRSVCCANVGGLPNVEVVQCAVGARTGRARFQQSRRSSESRLAIDEGRSWDIDVDVYAFDDQLDRLGLDHVDLLKVDIEGAEFDILEGAAWLSKVNELVGELHRDSPFARRNADRCLEAVAAGAGLSVAKSRHDVFVLRR
jgi:FkbM family methyltransferase